VFRIAKYSILVLREFYFRLEDFIEILKILDSIFSIGDLSLNKYSVESRIVAIISVVRTCLNTFLKGIVIYKSCY